MHTGRSQRSRLPPGRVPGLVLAAVLFVGAYIATREHGPSLGVQVTHSAAATLNETIFIATTSSTGCSNTCTKAHDGVCDEGRAADADSAAITCDLGTDLADCGPWAGESAAWHDDALGTVGPIQWLMSQNETCYMKLTTTQPPFRMMITDPARDPDVSAMLSLYGHMEGGLTRAMYEALSNSCRATTPPGLVLVVGAGFGYPAIYAASMGCRVVAWEPVPLLRAFLAQAAAFNNLTHLISIRPYAVSDLPPNSTVQVGVAKYGTYWGLASVDNLNLHAHEVRYTVTARTERLDDFVPAGQPVLMLKVDVEGYEPRVIASATRLISTRQAGHIMLEYSPGIAERHKDFRMLEGLPRMLQLLTKSGYRIGHLPTFAVAAPWPPKPMPEWYGKPWVTLEEVGEPELLADINAAQQWQRAVQNGSCIIPESLRPFGPWAGACNEWAAWAHPKGFRSSFGYNTNVWASLFEAGNGTSKPSGQLRLKGFAALFGRTQPLRFTWNSSSRLDTGIGLLPCSSIAVWHKLLFRCPCPEPDKCGKEAQVLQGLVNGGGVLVKD